MASQQAAVTLRGFVGTDPILRGVEGVNTVATFRVGTTRSYYHRDRGTWVECPTTWITVKAFRKLAENVGRSVHKRDAVIVTGMLGTDSWQTENGESRSAIVLEATAIGHDLNFGFTRLNRIEKPADAQQPAAGEQAQAAPAAAMPAGAPQAGAAAVQPVHIDVPPAQDGAPAAQGAALPGDAQQTPAEAPAAAGEDLGASDGPEF